MAKININKEKKVFSYKCDFCDKTAEQPMTHYYPAKARGQTLFFCSQRCKHNNSNKHMNFECSYCGEHVVKPFADVKKSKTGRFFCNQSHAAFYNNKIRKKSRRSKIEIKFYNSLVKEFPNLDILANDKIMLDGYEVDVAIPSLKLAIEWNGIVHFKPIYGQTKLSKIQTRDTEKLKIASNKDINLIVISDLVSNDEILEKSFNQCKDIVKDLLN
ncbi:hypothetical protein KAR91_68945 [Candidatus Pacearchaeota archaeon]|nr:hypothetical protein [Candidatus Pacearchaeota archaeon]